MGVERSWPEVNNAWSIKIKLLLWMLPLQLVQVVGETLKIIRLSNRVLKSKIFPLLARHLNFILYPHKYQTLLYRMAESATTASPSWLRCHVHIACVQIFMSNSPWPKLASLYAE